MSNRLTKHWTSTTEEAFGSRGSKGRIGELFALAVWSYWGYETWDLGEQRSEQIAGHDILIQKAGWMKPYSMDVKNNMDTEGGFFVELSDRGWLFNSKKTSHRICHVNPNMCTICWYDRYQMQNALMNRMTSFQDSILYLNNKSLPKMIHRRDLSSDEGFRKVYGS